MKNLPNEEVLNLLNQISQKNDKAFDRLMRFYQDDFVRLVYRKTLDIGAAEEIVNDLFMTVWKTPKQYNGTSKFSTFLYPYAMWAAIDWLRDNSRHPTDSYDEEEASKWPSLQDTIEEMLEKKERNDVLRACVDKLPDDQRVVVEFAYYHEEKHQIIAEALNIPLGTVKTRAKYSIPKLAQCLKRLLGQGD